MVSNMIEKMFNDQNKKKPVIVDLIRRNNVKFLSPGVDVFVPKVKRTFISSAKKSKHETSSVDVYYHPMFAAGNVMTSIMVESILSNAYQMPALTNVFNSLVGIRYPADREIDKSLPFEQCRLTYVQVPPGLMGRPFGEIYKQFSEVLGVVPLGIFRNGVSDDNVLPYVITNPLWSWLVHEHDLIYVLAPPSTLK
jgi:hypothetical protein